jgi:hypothetical protein
MRTLRIALLAALIAAPAAAQQFPTLPPGTVIGRLGNGFSGPSQAIPFSTLLANIAGTVSPNQVYAGPSSGSAVGTPGFRALVGADLPAPTGSTFGGVQSFTCASHNWFNTLSTAGVFGCSQPAFSDLIGTIGASQIAAATITSSMIAANAGIALSQLAAQSANTLVANATNSSALPTAVSIPSCGTATSALDYTSGTGFGCQTFGTIVAQSYSQGTWTPVLGGSTSGQATYTTQVGSYEQIGRHVTARFTIVTASVSGIVGTVQIQGLPVTVANTANDNGACSIAQMNGVTLDASYTFIGGIPTVNTTTVQLYENGSGQATSTFGNGKLAAATTLVGFCEYHS